MIPAGQSLSTAVDCTGFRVLHLLMPDDWTGTQPITFQLSTDGVIWNDLYRVETPALIPYEVATHVVLGAAVTTPAAGDLYSFVRIRSGSRAAPVPQAADRVFGLAAVPTTDPVAVARARADWHTRRLPPVGRTGPAASGLRRNTSRTA